MLDFPRWKVWAVSLTVAVGVLLSIPSLIAGTRLADYWPGWLPAYHINLGLDLAGGSQLLLEADVRDSAKQRLQAMEDSVSTELRRDPRVAISEISTAGGQLSFLVRNPAQVDTAVERLRTLTKPVGTFSAERDWTVRVMDSTRVVMAPTEAGNKQALQRRDDRRARRRPPPHRPAGHQGNHRHQPGRDADPGPGARSRGSRGAEGADRPDRAARIQACRARRRSCTGSGGPRPARRPGPADGRRHREHRRQAPGDGLGRPAGRRVAGLRRAECAGDQHQVQLGRRPPLRANDAGECRKAVRDHPRRPGAVGAQHQRGRSLAARRGSAAISPSRARPTSRSASPRASCR